MAGERPELVPRDASPGATASADALVAVPAELATPGRYPPPRPTASADAAVAVPTDPGAPGLYRSRAGRRQRGRHRYADTPAQAGRQPGAHRAGTGRARSHPERTARHLATARQRGVLPASLIGAAITMVGAVAVISGWFAASGAVALAAMVR